MFVCVCVGGGVYLYMCWAAGGGCVYVCVCCGKGVCMRVYVWMDVFPPLGCVCMWGGGVVACAAAAACLVGKQMNE